MVFLRPVVIRTQEAANALSMDRYDQIRALQRDNQPNPNFMTRVNEAPVVSPQRPASAPTPGGETSTLAPAKKD